MTENGPRRDKNLQLSRTSGKVTSPSKVDSQKHKTNQPQFINDLEVSSGSARTKPDNEVSEDKAVINAVENTRRMIDIEQAPVESDQESVGTWRSPKFVFTINLKSCNDRFRCFYQSTNRNITIITVISMDIDYGW